MRGGISTSRLRALLFAALAALGSAGLAAELAHARTHAPLVEWLVRNFSLSYEANVPTWYATCLLFCCAALLAAIARRASQRGDSWRRHWWVLCATFLYFSLDEATEIHENLGGLFGTGGVLYFDWVIPAALFVTLYGLAFLPFLRHLPAAGRRRFVIAGALYVGGALLMELPLGWWTERAGDQNLVYGLIDLTEETLELLGASLFLLALLQHYQGSAAPPAEEAT